jgi:formylglycine-generating enzyme
MKSVVPFVVACLVITVIAVAKDEVPSQDAEAPTITSPLKLPAFVGLAVAEATPQSVVLLFDAGLADSILPPVHPIEVESQEANKLTSYCPPDMKLVEGWYCPRVEEICLYYVDNKGNKVPPGDIPQQNRRCGEFKYPTRCLSEKRIYKRFCEDEFEIPNLKGVIPTSWMSYTDVENFCAEQDKRVCTSSEWEFSCEGKEIKPYPYDSGYLRDRTACNFDNDMPSDIDVFKATSHKTPMAIRLDNMLVPSGSMERCVSPFGIKDQVGNLDEWVINESGEGYHSGLKGGHIWGIRSRCRPMTTAHNGEPPVSFSWYETSGRCCRDAD